MKFSHSIRFNAVPDWGTHYIAYSNLKKLTYQLEKQVHQHSSGTQQAQHTHLGDGEESPLLSSTEEDPDKAFIRALDRELEKICTFYQLKELEIYGEVEHVLKQEQTAQPHVGTSSEAELASNTDANAWTTAFPPRSSRSGKPQSLQRSFAAASHKVVRARTLEYPQDSDDSSDETRLTAAHARSLDLAKTGQNPDDLAYIKRGSSLMDDCNDMTYALFYDPAITLKKSLVGVYVSLCELRSFIQLNRTGFTKVLKKYDKTLHRTLKSSYLEQVVMPAYPFQPSTMKNLSGSIGQTEQAYARLVQADLPQARRELRLHLREHVVWERNTVWREMIGIERKGQAANLGIRNTMLGAGPSARLQGDDAEYATKQLVTPLGKYRVPAWLLRPTFWTLVLITTVFLLILRLPILETPEQHNCLALVVFVSLLWASEAIPLFVTSLLVPFLVVILRVVRADGTDRRLDSKAATAYIFASMWTPVIMLLLGGFTIAAALSKYNIAKRMAVFVLSKAGTRPRNVLLASMFVATFASMWISNVAAPVLCFSIVQPILRNLSSDSNMSKALILGIALASNIGGAASPISSPQNLIALQNMSPEPGWGTWFFIALPICIISNLAIWLLLLITFQPGRKTTIVPIRPMQDPFTGIQWFITCVSLATIALWCLSNQIESYFGDMGVIAIIPLVTFFGTGILTKEDFNNFLWTIIILAAGGLALGKAVNSSGLLHTLAQHISLFVDGMGLYGVTFVFAGIVLVVATFISHTVAALIFLPLVLQVGQGMAEPHPNLLVMASVLMCSAAMGLPTSGFPNMTAIMMEDKTGQRYLDVKHFLSRGVPSSLLVFAVVMTIGYGLMLLAGF